MLLLLQVFVCLLDLVWFIMLCRKTVCSVFVSYILSSSVNNNFAYHLDERERKRTHMCKLQLVHVRCEFYLQHFAQTQAIEPV